MFTKLGEKENIYEQLFRNTLLVETDRQVRFIPIVNDACHTIKKCISVDIVKVGSDQLTHNLLFQYVNRIVKLCMVYLRFNLQWRNYLAL